MALQFGHARNIAWTDFHIGASVKFISSTLEQYSSFGVAADIGAMDPRGQEQGRRKFGDGLAR